MKKRDFIITGISALVTPKIAIASEIALSKVPNARLVGRGRLRLYLVSIFDAFLYAPNGRFSFERPFALKITYHHNVRSSEIVKRSISEIRAQGFRDEAKLRQWQTIMTRLFPNINAGQSLIGLRNEDGHAEFYSDNGFIGAVNDIEFANKFFAIWLGQNSTQPHLRQQLLGR